MSTVLITGGAGFIGTAIGRYLLDEGHRVLCFDNLVTAERLGDLAGRVEAVEGDILDRDTVDALVARVDRVIHLAAVVGVDEYMNRPLDVLDTNILGTRHLLLACKRHGKPVVFASTSEVYGKNYGNLAEDVDRVYGSAHRNRWSYAISKSACEHYAYALAPDGLDFVAVRYFNVFGPRLDAPGRGRVVSKFLGKIRDGEPLELVDGGAAVRAFCYVDDAAEATARLALELGPGAPFRGSSINIGRAEAMTMRQLAETMIALSGHRAGTVDVFGEEHFGAGFEDIPHRVPELDRLETAIGFRARTPVCQGLAATLDHWGLLAEHAAPTESDVAETIPEIRPTFDPTPTLMGRLGRLLASGRVTNGGPNLERFERTAADYLAVEDAVAVTNGAEALELALALLGRSGKAILPSYTFIATLNAVADAGLEPVFADIDPETFTLCPDDLARRLDEHPDVAVVVPVNVFGVPPALGRIARLATAAGADLVYDNAQGFGTEVAGERTATEPVAQIFSFHATKVMPAVEGGLLVASDPALLAEARRLRNHGIAQDRLASTPGRNAKLDELRATIGLHSLERFPMSLARRRSYARRLRDHLARPELAAAWRPQRIPDGVRSNAQNFGALAAAAPEVGLQAVLDVLRAEGVGCRSYFDPALHHLEAYRQDGLPVTDRVWTSLVSLPIHSRMAEHELVRIERALETVAERFAGAGSEPLITRATA